ncbi:MAG: hypothetical protein M3R36_19310 [Bacteroidota bacterium]|nr:hypothetical protein [Bacteroidota bacterium]
MKKKEEILKEIEVLELLNKEVLNHHPEGSMIVFSSKNLIDNEPDTFTCNWYDKKGIGFPLQNIIEKPKEWQELTLEETSKICSMFDESIVTHRVSGIAINHNYCEDIRGIKMNYTEDSN